MVTFLPSLPSYLSKAEHSAELSLPLPLSSPSPHAAALSASPTTVAITMAWRRLGKTAMPSSFLADTVRNAHVSVPTWGVYTCKRLHDHFVQALGQRSRND